MPFDPATIERLAAILKDQGLTEIEVSEGESRLRLTRAVAVAAAVPAPAPLAAPMPPPEPQAAAFAPAGSEPPVPAGAVTSPMVGVAYLSPDPNSPPFVTVGQAVTAGQTLLLIEAMKTFNQIKAPKAGTVRQILVASGEPVEYGQPLVVVG